MAAKAVILDPDEEMRDLFIRILKSDGHDAVAVPSVQDFPSIGPDTGPDVLFAVTDSADDASATEAAVHEYWPTCAIVYVVDTKNRSRKRELERSRIRHLVRPCRIEDIKDLVERLMQRHGNVP